MLLRKWQRKDLKPGSVVPKGKLLSTIPRLRKAHQSSHVQRKAENRHTYANQVVTAILGTNTYFRTISKIGSTFFWMSSILANPCCQRLVIFENSRKLNGNQVLWKSAWWNLAMPSWGSVWVSSEVGSQSQLYTVLESTPGHPRWLFWKTDLLLCKLSCALSGCFFLEVSAACHEGTKQPRDLLSLLRSASQPLNRHGQVP